MIPKKRSRRIEAEINKLIKRKNHPGEMHCCPECKGQLHVRFEVYRRANREMLGVHAWCDDCDAALAVDYAEPIPAWLRDDTGSRPIRMSDIRRTRGR
jgi:uncharacterized protein YbaR (Trm112 family)